MRQEPWAKDQGGSQEVTGVPKAETGKWGDREWQARMGAQAKPHLQAEAAHGHAHPHTCKKREKPDGLLGSGASQ